MNPRASSLRSLRALGRLASARWIMAMLLGLSPGASILAPSSTRGDDPPIVRELFVPFEELDLILEADPNRVFLSRDEYERLVRDAAERPVIAVPRDLTLSRVDSRLAVRDGRGSFTTTIEFEVLAEAKWLELPLSLAGVGLRSARLDGEAAPLRRDDQGRPSVLVRGAGIHRLELAGNLPLEQSGIRQVLNVTLPQGPSGTTLLEVAGDVEAEGSAIAGRTFDAEADVTRFDLVPQQAGLTLVLTTNNRSAQDERIYVARSVLIDELTSAYERLHASVSVEPVAGTLEVLELRLPNGFEVMRAEAPQIARWEQIVSSVDERRLRIVLSEPVESTLVMSILLQRTEALSASIGDGGEASEETERGAGLEENRIAWSFPHLPVVGASGEVTVVGLWVEELLVPGESEVSGLVPVDSRVLQASVPASLAIAEPGAPRLRQTMTYYAPSTEFRWNATIARQPSRLAGTVGSILTVGDRRLELQGTVSLRSEGETRFDWLWKLPPGWEIESLSDAAGNAVAWERIVADATGTTARVKVPSGIRPGVDGTFDYRVSGTPSGWLDAWTERNLEVPSVAIDGAEIERGAIGVVVRDDLEALPLETDGLVPLLDNELAAVGLAGLQGGLAYRFAGESRLVLQVTRAVPTLTAREYSLYSLQPGRVRCAHELHFTIREASARSLEFSLPESTPREIGIRGLGGLAIGESSSRDENGRRLWQVRLASAATGEARLAIDYEQTIEDAATIEWGAPMIRAEGVAFRSTTFGIDGDADLSVDVTTDARRVDEGELAASELPIGRRSVGTFGKVDGDPVATVSIRREAGYGLPSAVIDRAELTTRLGLNGRAQSIAAYRLATKATLLELRLPKGSELWGAKLDDLGLKPQRSGDRLLIGLPASSSGAARRLEIVYETPIPSIAVFGSVSLPAPELATIVSADADGSPIPTADVEWIVLPPDGYSVTDRDGTVRSVELRRPYAGPELLLGAMVELFRPRRIVSESVAAKFEMVLPQASFDGAMANRPMAPGAEPMTWETPSPSNFLDLSDETMALDAGRPPIEQAPQSEARTSTEELREKAESDAPPSEPRRSNESPMSQVPSADADLGEDRSGLSSRERGATGASLEGVRSLAIDLVGEGDQVRFVGLGEAPRLEIGVHVTALTQLYGLAIAAVGLLIGLALRWTAFAWRLGWIVLLLAAGAIPPCLTAQFDASMPIFAGAFLAGCLLAFVETMIGLLIVPCAGMLRRLRSGIASRLGRRVGRVGASATVGLIAVLLSLGGSAVVAQDSIPAPVDVESIRNWLAELEGEVRVPEDAVIVPFDPEFPGSADEGNRILIPYAKYVELWNRAYPDKPLTAPAASVAASVSAASHRVTLIDADAVTIEGTLTIDLFSDRAATIPIPFSGGTLVAATLDGRTARLESIQPGAVPDEARPLLPPGAPPAALLLHVEGEGRHRFEFSARFAVTKQGGWRAISGHLPSGPAAEIAIELPTPGTELRQSQLVDAAGTKSTAPNERFESPLGEAGAFSLQWRSDVSVTEVDRALTAVSTALFDVREDGARMTWKVDLAFPGTPRDRFSFAIPGGWKVERVVGANLRAHQVIEEGDRQRIEVTLLEAASGSESFLFGLTRRESFSGKTLELQVPYVSVVGAALESGELAVRRSARVRLSTLLDDGLSRLDLTEGLRAMEGIAESYDPAVLRLVPHQSFRFVKPPFVLRIEVQPAERSVAAEWRATLRVDRREVAIEGLFRFVPQGEPLYRVEISWPEGYRLDRLAPEGLEWSVIEEEGRRRLSVDLLDGRTEPFELAIFARTARADDVMEGVGDRLELPRFELPGVDSRKGEWAILGDPDTDVRIENAIGLRERQASEIDWLGPAQQGLAKVGLEVREAQHSADVVLVPRVAQVSARTLTNVRVSNDRVEETTLIDFDIRQAGIRTVRIDLPADRADARVMAKLLRRKSWTDAIAADGTPREGWKTLELELQDSVRGTYSVLIEHDRAADGSAIEVRLAEVRTGRTDRRLLAIENVGRDEVVVGDGAAIALEPVSRQEQAWRDAVGILGDTISQLFVARDDTPAARLTLQVLERQQVARVGAVIPLAMTLLVVDDAGAYRGQVEYRVANADEPFLEIELPDGATLWTASVAGRPIRPLAVPGQTDRRSVRLPLIRTAEGEGDYPVVVRYGGRIDLGVEGTAIRFPLIAKTNINVELSQLRLYLPEDRVWFDVDGTMTRAKDETELAIGFQSYLGKRIVAAQQALASVGAFGSVRTSVNLKEARELYERNRSEITARSSELSHEWMRVESSNGRLLSEAERQVEEQLAESNTASVGNRDRLNSFYSGQGLQRSSNVVSDLGLNFGVVAGEGSGVSNDGAADFNENWNDAGFGDVAATADAPITRGAPVEAEAGNGRFYRGRGQRQTADDESFRQQNSRNLGRYDNAALDPLANEEMDQRSQAAPADKLERYRDQLSQQSRDLSLGAVGGPLGGGMPATPSLETGAGAGLMPPTSGPAGAMGGYGFGGSGGLMAGVDSDSVTERTEFEDTGWDSLETELPRRGQLLMFSTPRGGIEVTARSIDRDRIERSGMLGAVLLMLIVVGLVGRRIARPDRPFPFQSRRAGLLLVTASIVLLVLVGPSLPALAVLAFGTLRAIRPVRAKTVSAPAIA